MVKPGQSPETYDPSPKQIIALSQTNLFIGAGMPIESTWLDQLDGTQTEMTILISGKEPDLVDANDDHIDLHTWLSPMIVRQLVDQIRQRLKELLPQQEELFKTNMNELLQDLGQLDQSIKQRLQDFVGSKFLVFHPAWGHFANAYGLEQVAIEEEGKPPGPKRLSDIIQLARRENIKTVFVQPQHYELSANIIAKAIDGKVVSIDPLSRNYIENLERTVDVIVNSYAEK